MSLLNNQRLIIGGFLILAAVFSISRISMSFRVVSVNNVDHLETAMIQPGKRLNSTSSSIQGGANNLSSSILRLLPPKQQAATTTAGSSPAKSQSHPTSSAAGTKSETTASGASVNKTLSICLLLKDDNDILNEWIAYHYHALNLRHMIVAVDPSSQTSPSDLFQKWRKNFLDDSNTYNNNNNKLSIEEWTDTNYMPGFFLRGDYDQVPSFIPAFMAENVSASIWHQDVSNETQVKDDLLKINNHRFRQVTFVSKCFQELRKQGKQWVAHIDTDEYIVINPKLRDRPNAVKPITVPTAPHQGSVLDFLEDMFVHYKKRLTRKCLMMPSLLFGSVEDPNNRTQVAGWNTTKFETIRWTHHARFNDNANGLQKAIVDVSVLPDNHAVFEENRIKSVHQPLEYPECRKFTLKPDVDAVRLFPLTVNHYVGSLERYMARSDLRRNVAIYNVKAKVDGGVDSGWIQGWISSFERMYGAERSNSVLADYRY